MKKIFSLAFLLSFFCLTTINAQRSWSVADESTTAIKEGKENIYVLQEGFGVHSQNGYLSNKGGDKCETEPVASTIFSFIKVDEKKEASGTYPVYVLYNHENKMYLSNGEGFVKQEAKAYKFTARLAKETDASNNAYNTWDWETYSQGVDAEWCVGAEEAHAWVLCSVNGRNYIGFYANPSFMGYVDTGHWLVKEAKEIELSAFEKLAILFQQHFMDGVDEQLFPVGTAPGCISPELYAEIFKVYNDANTFISSGNTDEAASLEFIAKINAVMERYAAEIVPLGPGFFLWVNKRSMDAAFDAGDKAKTSLHVEAPSEWNLANTKYIWEVVNSSKAGQFYLKNWGTGRYLGKSKGTSQPYPMVADSTDAFSAKRFDGLWFLINDADGQGVHNAANAEIVRWNSTDAGNLWKFTLVDADTIAKLKVEVEQNLLNKKMSDMIANTYQIEAAKTLSGIISTGAYSTPMDSGLVRDLTGHQGMETTEGSVEGLFDGNLDTYYHTSWHHDNAPEGYHYVTVDLGKDVTDMIIKFSKRHNVDNGTPTKLEFLGTEDNLSDTPYMVELAKVDTVVYAYNTFYAGAPKDSCTYIDTIHFNQPARYIQMNVTGTKINGMVGTDKKSGPFWHISELRFYDLKDCVENPKYTIIPQTVKDELDAAIAAAKAEIEAKAATEVTYKRLEAAIEAFWEAYPDPSGLLNALKEATSIADAAIEGSELGCYEVGATDALKKVIADIQKVIEEKEAAKGAFSLEEIKKYDQQLTDALKAFQGKLITPAPGVYCIVCTAGTNANGEIQAQDDACIATENADYKNGTPVWRYAFSQGVDDRFNTLWLVEKDEAGFTLKNLANGLYMGNAYEGLSEEDLEDADIAAEVGFSKEPKHFNLEAFASENGAGSFLLGMYKNQFVNLDPRGIVVHWGDRNDTHAAFKFEPVSDEDFNNVYLKDVKAGKTQIITLPFAVTSVYNEGNGEVVGGAYKVLGKKDGKIQLDLYSDEVIPAGTPFIISTRQADPSDSEDKGENTIEVELSAQTLDEAVKMEHVLSPVIQGGLVSAPIAVTPGAGYGVLYDGKVLASDESDVVAAGSGYFNSSIEEAAAAGTFELVIEGDISGEGTGIENAVIVKNVSSDVYTVSGLKVRQNVKAGVATQGLPKGVYIVNGKKVIIK